MSRMGISMELHPARQILSILGLLLAPAYDFAQIDRASLSGTVRDTAGARLPGARVTALQTATGPMRETDSSANGVYVIPELPIGLNRVTCSAPGFQQAIFDNLEQSVGHTLRLDITRPIGGITQQVNVSGINAELDDIAATLGARVESP
jgi:hypothetical protein